MQTSHDRILTTHTGSLPRPEDLVSIFENHDQRELETPADFDERVASAVRDIVGRQSDTGLDVINDGELSKVGYATYVTERLSGFGEDHRGPGPMVEFGLFPDYYREHPIGGAATKRPACVGPITWRGAPQLERDIDNLKAATRAVNAREVFMTAASPGLIWYSLENDFYPTDEAYLVAAAEAMRHEYRAIVDAGILLQLDCPDLAMGWNRYSSADLSIDEFRSLSAMHVEALNYALEGIAPDRVRIHLCWGNIRAPHVRDIPLASIWDIVLQAHACAFSFEAANPRHAHEWKFFQDVQLPEGTILIPGMLDSTTNFVEHPELIAQRLVRFAGVAGRNRVIAGADCGFSSTARSQPMVHPTVVWAKLQSLVEGARLASAELWR